MSIDKEALAKEMRYHARLKGRDTTSDYVLGWDDATTVLLARLVPAEDEGRRITGRDVHREWRDGMLAQGREVAPERMAWDTLTQQDRDLDERIAARLVPAEDEGRLREALREAADEAHVFSPSHAKVPFETCSYEPCRKRRAALAATPEPRT
jgi:hypothetical protein